MTTICEICKEEILVKEKTHHFRRHHKNDLNEYNQYFMHCTKCTKLYWEVVKKITEIELYEKEISSLELGPDIVTKSWFNEYLNSRTQFFNSINDISKK